MSNGKVVYEKQKKCLGSRLVDQYKHGCWGKMSDQIILIVQENPVSDLVIMNQP